MTPDFNWIEQHFDDNPSALRLKYGKEHGDDILQIEMRKKHGAKFAETLKENPEFVFPTSLSAEQSTSDLLAAFHSSLIESGAKVADLTAGLGIDAMAFAKKAAYVAAVEKSKEVAAALEKNTEKLKNLQVFEGDCRNIVENWVEKNEKFDAVFIDPARRDSAGGRVFALESCEPDVVEMLPLIAKITPRLIVKASPMLDISHTVGELSPYVVKTIALGTTTECKELLAVCELTLTEQPETTISAVTLGPELKSEFSFTRNEEAKATAKFGVPKAGDIILDPYPAVMKAAPNRLLGERYGVTKIGSNTHLWFSNEPVERFPGSEWRIIEVLPYMSKHIKRYSSRFPKVSVTARNFDISSDALRAKLKVSDGPLRLFAVNAFDGRKLLITCEKI